MLTQKLERNHALCTHIYAIITPKKYHIKTLHVISNVDGINLWGLGLSPKGGGGGGGTHLGALSLRGPRRGEWA